MSRILIAIGLLQVLLTLVGLARSKALAVMLSPSGFGIVATIDQLVMVLMQLGGLGLSFVALRFMARAHAEGPDALRLVGAGFGRLIALCASLTALIAIVLVQIWPSVIGVELAPYGLALKLAIVGVPALMLGAFAVNMLAAVGRPLAAAGLNLVAVGAAAIGAVLGAAMGGLDALYLGVALSGVVVIAIAAATLSRTLGVHWLAGAGGSAHLRGLRRDVTANAMSVYSVMVVYAGSLFAVRLAVLVSLGEASVGVMQAGMSLALTVGGVLAALGNLYFVPMLNRQPDVASMRATADRYALQMLLVLLVGAMPILLVPDLVIALLYTRAFAPAAAVLFILMIWQCLAQLTYVYQQLLMALDDTGAVAGLGLLGFGGGAVFTALLAPRFGLTGAASGLALGMVVYAAAIALRLALKHRITVGTAVALRLAWILSVIACAGLLFRGGEPFSIQGMTLRVGFTTAVLAMTVVLFLRHGAANAISAFRQGRLRTLLRLRQDP
ncbi:hypothetical protein [Phenylobacterium sp.]|uniref:hypothetical protein n=1 Tax=Phenylobacterium sp. TaxID=1871053 RepID=UPI00273441F6|nr:hypothetical protein [Phenylobacterium sp.]MDP3659109.1 hypothetical protein [Phenylobacterium sp.]